MMACIFRRYHITNALAILVVTMIMVNLYALAVVLGGGQAITSSEDGQTWNAKSKLDNVVFSQNASGLRFVVSPDGDLVIHSRIPLKFTKIYTVMREIRKKYREMRKENPVGLQYLRVVNKLKRILALQTIGDSLTELYVNANNFLNLTNAWPFNTDSLKFQSMGEILRFAENAKILQAKNSRRGTQLKIEVILEGGQMALFKPCWYPNGIVINGTAYGGKDRHFGEVAAFYLNHILGYNSAPITLGRRINLFREVYNFASDQLKQTFFRDSENNLCFYGVCYYCKAEDPVCAQGNLMDGALILLLDKKLKIVANPWRRTYKEPNLASWETELSFCSTVLKDASSAKRTEAILDVVAVAIFDFLIGNADRHHFEMYGLLKEQMTTKSHSGSIFLIDNGKSFGKSTEDYIDVLAPLYQCCKIRRSLYTALSTFRNVLGKSLATVSSTDALHPLLAKEHLNALDRRLLLVLATVQVCLDRFSVDDVFFND